MSGWLGVEAIHCVLIKQRNSSKHKHRQKRMNEVQEPELVLGGKLGWKCSWAVKNPEALECGEPVEHCAIPVPEAITEAKQEAWDAAEG